MTNFELKNGLKVKFTRDGVAQEGVVMINLNKSFSIRTSQKYNSAPEDVHDLRPAEGFWPVQGDVLVAGDKEKKVLGVCGNAYFVSNINIFDSACGVYFTREELIDNGYKIKGQEEPKQTELTKEEACTLLAEKLGVDKKTIRIKD